MTIGRQILTLEWRFGWLAGNLPRGPRWHSFSHQSHAQKFLQWEKYTSIKIINKLSPFINLHFLKMCLLNVTALCIILCTPPFSISCHRNFESRSKLMESKQRIESNILHSTYIGYQFFFCYLRPISHELRCKCIKIFSTVHTKIMNVLVDIFIQKNYSFLLQYS